MKLLKLVLTLFVAVIVTAASGQDSENLVRKDWEKRVDGVTSIKEIVDLHRKNKKTLTSKNDLLANDIFAVITAGYYIHKNIDKKIEPAEKQLYTIVKSVDITTKEFADFFSKNSYPLKAFFYVKYISEGEPRQLAMGGDYESMEYDYKRVIEVLEKCDVTLRENHCSSLLTDRMDANENLRVIEPILERQLPESDFKRRILKRIDVVKPLLKGGVAPDWSYPDRHGYHYSLKDFRGKFLVIDMWATWCGGCVRDIGKFSKLGDKFSDREDIQFVTISIDDAGAYHDWKYSLAKFGLMKSVSLVTLGDDSFEKNYHFTGVPRYMIIDPQGIIVTTSAPSPSTPSLEQLIVKTLKEYDAKAPAKELSIDEKRAKLDQTISEFVINGDSKTFNPTSLVKVTSRIMAEYASMGFEKDAKYYYVEALNFLSKNEVASSFDVLKETIFKKGKFNVSDIETIIFLGKVALYPYQNLGLEESRIAKKKIEEIIEVVKDDKASVDYLKGYVNKYDNKIKYILTDAQIEKK